MMDRAIVHNEDTAHGWIWVHLLKKFGDEVEEGVAVESPEFNAATDDAVKCECRQYGESRLKLSKKKQYRTSNEPGTTDKMRQRLRSLPLLCPSELTVCVHLVDGALVNEHQVFSGLISNADDVFGAFVFTALDCNF